jgi:hypothetical protein
MQQRRNIVTHSPASRSHPHHPCYQALCYHFNANLAAAAGISAGVLAWAFQRSSGVSFLPPAPFFNGVADMTEAAAAFGFDITPPHNPQYPLTSMDYKPPISCASQLLGGVVFLAVLCFGHLNPRKMFLDKVCIHQTNPEQKLKGILAIDQFVFRSDVMLICFNNDVSGEWGIECKSQVISHSLHLLVSPCLAPATAVVPTVL